MHSVLSLNNNCRFTISCHVKGHAIGIPDSDEGITTSHIEANLKSAISLHGQANSAHKPSMLLDMENGLPLEVEPILGEVVRLAEQYNVDIPVGVNVCQSCIEADQECDIQRTQMMYALLLVIQNQILRERNV